MSIPDSIATTTAREVVKGAVFKALGLTVEDLLGSGQIDHDDALEITQAVSKALLDIAPEVGETEVLKSLSYGALTTDTALMTGGAALTGVEPEPLSEYAKRRIAKALYDDTVSGVSPVSKAVGYEPPEDMEEFRTDIADCFMQEFGMGADDGLECAQMFFDHFRG